MKQVLKDKALRRTAGIGVTYTEADLKFIEKNITKMKLTEMAVYLDRTFETLRHKVSKMGLSNQRIYSFKPYTADDVAFLEANSAKYTHYELAEMTGRSYDSIEKKLRKLKLKASNSRKPKKIVV